MTKKKPKLALLLLLYLPTLVSAANLGGRLQYMLWQQQSRGETLTKPGIVTGHTTVTLRTHRPFTRNDIRTLMDTGVNFRMNSVGPVQTGNIYTVHIPINILPELSKHANIVSIEYAGRDQQIPCLNQSAQEVQANLCWPIKDKRLQHITGKGVTIGIVDNPPDIFHPMFWRADGDTLTWIDVNNNQQYDSGTDGIDYNGNGTVDNNEILDHINAPVIDIWDLFPLVVDDYDPAYDWLYLDSNQNSQRDYGPGAGYSETDPSYGEPLFVSLDANNNGRLDTDEKLLALTACKVRRVQIDAGTDDNNMPVYHTFERGVNLIELDQADAHGTAVGGIVVGGIPGITALTGIAPDAELVYGDVDYLAGTDIDIILFEQGWYSQQFMDGSSHDEIRIDTLAARGIIPVVPSGNMNHADVHMAADVPANDSIRITIHWPDIENSNGNPFFISFLWDEPDSNFSYTLHSPEGIDYKLDNDEHITLAFNYQIWGNFNISDRGTRRYDIVLFKTNRTSETWELTIHNHAGETRHTDGYVYDPRFGWNHQARFLSYTNKQVTMTVPSTADSAIRVGSYNIRQTNENDGDLSGYSGQGPRIDGARGVDITAPGKLIFTSDVNSRYTQFSGGYWGVEGTSFSGPHAAGVVALLLQMDSNLSVTQIRDLLQRGALNDEQTGVTPNDAWGGGKLRALNTIKLLPQFPGEKPTVELPTRTSLRQNYPNPFNGGTTILYELENNERVAIHVYNILGQRVDTIYNGYQSAGVYTLNWDAGTRPSGVYFIQLLTSNAKKIIKCTILR